MKCLRIPNSAGLASWTTTEFLSCCLSLLPPSQMAWAILQIAEREAEYYLRMLSFRTKSDSTHFSERKRLLIGSLLLVYRTVRMKLFNYNYHSLLVAVFKHNRKRKHNPRPNFINIKGGVFVLFFCFLGYIFIPSLLLWSLKKRPKKFKQTAL